MQGQDLPGVIASIALRLAPGEADDLVRAVLAAFDDGTVVRGYPMRGTVFAVAAEDLRWMTELCAGGPTRAQVARRGQLGLDEEQISRGRTELEALVVASPRGVSRKALFARWDEVGLASAGGRGYHALSYLIQTGVAAYGPWNGSDNDVVLCETWLPAKTSIAERFNGDSDAAVAEMLLRYLTSHGPATVRDFAWWTKLTLAAIQRALPLVSDRLEVRPGDGEAVYERPGLDAEVAAAGSAVDELHLLPGFDEIVLGYPDRMVLIDPDHHTLLVPGNNGIFQRGILHEGRIVGLWRRGGRAGKRALETTIFDGLPGLPEVAAADAYARFPFVGG